MALIALAVIQDSVTEAYTSIVAIRDKSAFRPKKKNAAATAAPMIIDMINANASALPENIETASGIVMHTEMIAVVKLKNFRIIP